MNDKEGLGDDQTNGEQIEKKPMEPVVESADEPSTDLAAESDTQDEETDEKMTPGEIEQKFSFDRPPDDAADQRSDIAERFRERIGMEEEKEKYEAIQPQLKTNYWWTVILVIIITICLGIIIYLLVTRGTTRDVVNVSDQVLVFNEKKSRYDQSLVDAVNKINQAEVEYNQGNYAAANEAAKEAGRNFSTALDYLYDVQSIELGSNYDFLTDYFRWVEEASTAGENMSDALAYSARSADRNQGGEAKKSLAEYEGFRQDFIDASAKIEVIKKDNSDLFVE